jgi:hypothetical protein
MVIFTSGYCWAKARKTGTVIATSPIAESRITAICLILVDNFLSGELFFILVQHRIQVVVVVHFHLLVDFHELVSAFDIAQQIVNCR